MKSLLTFVSIFATTFAGSPPRLDDNTPLDVPTIDSVRNSRTFSSYSKKNSDANNPLENTEILPNYSGKYLENAFPNNNFEHDSGNSAEGKVKKFVTIHVGPEEPQSLQTKVIRPQGFPDKHVNIIFVKAPSTSNLQNTEVVLPEVPQQKTLVYVLVKKQNPNNSVRIRAPIPTQPPNPQVYFIRYRNGSKERATRGKGRKVQQNKYSSSQRESATVVGGY